MATLTVPEAHLAAVRELLALDVETAEKLDAGLAGVKVDREAAVALASSVLEHGEKAVDTLVSLSAARFAHGMTAEEVASMVPGSVGEGQASAPTIQRLIENATIAHLAKRADLATAFERGLHTFRIFTDIRPVFADDPSEPIKAAIVTHNVQVTYVQDNEFKELYFVADNEDLQSLKRQVDRAIGKAQTAEKFLDMSGVAMLRKLSDPR